MLYLQLSNSKDKVFCFCCWKFIDYFVKKLIRFKRAKYFNLKISNASDSLGSFASIFVIWISIIMSVKMLSL